MKDDLRYTPSDCYETFPFPVVFASNAALETTGKAYYDFRAALMVRNNEGLTKTYNRFHDPNERDPDILKLRELHDAMDRAVLTAYGPPFSDFTVPSCEFLLDYEIDDEEWGDRKKPYRYRWSDDVQAEGEKLATAIAENSSYSLRGVKSVVRRILDGQTDDDAATLQLFADAFTGEDFVEGVAAFLEKRKARFR